MSNARFAVIDLGTNTFHVLIVEALGTSWNELHRERIFINLAEGGIARISESAQERGLKALRHFRDVIDTFQVNETVAVGTAALRNAENSPEFVRLASQETGIDIQIIDGQTEARYINAGVMKALPSGHGDLLVMDIGGGSVELIVVSNGKAVYSVSHPIGVAVLYDTFHKTEPISAAELASIDVFLDDTLRILKEKVKGLGKLELVGASGTFEVIDSVLHDPDKETPYSTIEKRGFYQMYERVTPMTIEQRLADSSIPETRAQYIVVALKLIQYVLSNFDISAIGVSRYALKEGIVSEWLQNLD